MEQIAFHLLVRQEEAGWESMPLFTNAHIRTVLTTSVLPRQPIELKKDIHGSMKTWCDRESAKKKETFI